MPKTQATRNWIQNNREYYNAMQNIYVKEHYLRNREAKLAYAKEYREKNKETILQKQREKYHEKKMQEIESIEQNI